ncbi:MAG TPA: Rne/Rng family ribonuclease [Terriglobales bacterium]|nr:Rne/Rng family ribonuclease [Terriglobales bacterium]
MNRELYVSSTPHETKVGVTEDDQLAEIYLERENEYTLAGSIYKGRVTRVLPGMQSAFVDIGLERDAFLYVSDFMEVEEEEEVEEVPIGRVAAVEPTRVQPHPQPQASAPQTLVIEGPDFPEETGEAEASSAPARPRESRELSNGEQEDRGNWRNRRRRRGRRGERFPESKFARPVEHPREPRSEHAEYGPPPGYQPIILPGESISKYQRRAQPTPAPMESAPATTESAAPDYAAIAASFPDDEPLFAEMKSAQAPVPVERQEQVEEQTASERERDQEDEKLEAADLAPVMESESVSHEEEAPQPAPEEPVSSEAAMFASAPRTMEEEVIEEEEADLAHYVEDLEEDATFEEMEEETRAAEDYHGENGGQIAASAESSHEETMEVSGEIGSEVSVEEGSSEEEEDEEEAELEEAQAEAEALLDAEARGNGTVDARVEVRAPAGTAGYTQRAPRPGFDRRGGRGRRGGKRFQRRREPQNIPQITDLLKEGQEILVQIAKEPIGKKGARITSHIALPGRFLVYMPTVNHTGVSRKIASEEERMRLKRIIQSERENGHGGFIVRTAAQGANEEELRADIRFLKGLWTEIKSRAESSKGPTLIYHDLNVVERVLRDQVTSDFSAIWVDNEQEYERILRFANRFQPALVKRVKLYTKETPLFEQFGLREEIDKALKSKVWLKSGGYIVINQTEALVAIDVNTGKYVGKTARLEDTIVKTNVDAIKEIVRQIRLRDLGGIIVIDFIDMDERRNRQKVMQALEEALRMDRAPSKVLQFNDFGLVAITRKRVKQSLERTIGSPCPYCQSTGFVKSVTTVCNEIYLEMRKIAKHLEHADVLLRVNPEVAKTLKSNNGRALNEMEELTKKTIIVKSDPALHQEQFDIN